jgi:hypothetical protein
MEVGLKKMHNIRNWWIASAIGVSLGFAAQTNAAVNAYLVIDGTKGESMPVMPGINVMPFSWGTGNAGSVNFQGPNPGTGLLFDAGVGGAITMMSTAPGAQTLDITETGLTTNSPIPLVGTFTGQLFNSGDTLTRTFTITPNGASPITLGSVSGGATAGKVVTMPGSFTGTYTVTELIVFDAVKSGDSFSIDDSVMTPTAVPEPATLGLLALGFAGVGFARRKRKN